MNKVLKNVEVMWCKFNSVDQYGKFSCTLNLTKDHIKTLQEWGLKVSKDKENKPVYRARCDEDRGPIEVVDKQGAPVTCAISNGALANVMLDVYQYQRYGGGTAARLKKVQLLKYEPYQEGEDFEYETEDEKF